MSSDQHKDRPAELVFAILISVFSVGALWQAYEISGFKSLTSAGVFPMLAAGTMLVSALIILCAQHPEPFRANASLLNSNCFSAMCCHYDIS